jgi:predicted  nucleic acid-binding Zn-ribbon protein
MKQATAQPAAKTVKEKKERTITPQAAQKKNVKQLEKQIAKLEREIEKQEALLSELEEKIQEAASDYEALSGLLEEQTAAQSRMEEMYAQWEELSGALEA